MLEYLYRGADKSLARPGRKQATATEDFDVHISIYKHNWRNISTIYIYVTRLASNEIFSPSNKIHREVGRAKDLSAPLYLIKVDFLLVLSYVSQLMHGHEQYKLPKIITEHHKMSTALQILKPIHLIEMGSEMHFFTTNNFS